MSVNQATLHGWSGIPSQEMAPGVSRQYLTASRVTIGRFHLARGAVIPAHAHENEQVSCVLTGALNFRLGEREVVVRAGQVLEIPSWVEHGVTVLEEADVLDVFCPVRQDWIDGTDAYFRR